MAPGGADLIAGRYARTQDATKIRYLMSLLRLPFLSVGIIPADARRHAIASIGFWILDNNEVAMETPTAAIKVTRPKEIALFGSLMHQLRAEAVHGTRARLLIAEVVSSL